MRVDEIITKVKQLEAARQGVLLFLSSPVQNAILGIHMQMFGRLVEDTHLLIGISIYIAFKQDMAFALD